MAASAASLVLMSGNVIEMPENSFLMIHNPWGFVFGESEELRDHADLMDKFKETAINIYEAKSSLSRDEISEMMSNETWMDANEALEKGFIDTVIEPVEIAASINNFSKHFKTMPFEAKNKIESITSIKEYEKTLRDSGFSRSEANMMVSQLKAIIQSDSEELPEADLKELEAALMLMNVPKSLKN
jgi:membrane-bound ClpP family serine protease